MWSEGYAGAWTTCGLGLEELDALRTFREGCGFSHQSWASVVALCVTLSLFTTLSLSFAHQKNGGGTLKY